MKNIQLLSLTVIASLSMTTMVKAADRDGADYAGVKMCGICHKSEAGGNQLAKWQASPHAKAFETLGTPAAKEVAKKLGIDAPQKSGKCLKCHSTAYNFTETAIANEKVKVEDGVTCESCHGPGNKYKSKSTMESREKAVAAGMTYPAIQSCKLCHNEQSPSYKGFEEKAMVEKIAHPDPKVKK
jgi:hypothetical protein